MNPDTKSVGGQEHTPVVCSPCSREDAIETATQFCYECHEPMCDMCAKYHKRNKASSRHKLVSGDEVESGRIRLATSSSDVLDIDITCELHNHKKFKYVCRKDNKLCCSRCVIEHHRSCKNVLHFSEYTACGELKNQLKLNERNVACLKQTAHTLIAHETEHVDLIRDIEQLEIEKENVVRDQLIFEIQKAFADRKTEIKSKVDDIVTNSEKLQSATRISIAAIEQYALSQDQAAKYGTGAKKVVTVVHVANHMDKIRNELMANYENISEETIVSGLQIDHLKHTICAMGPIKTARSTRELPGFDGTFLGLPLSITIPAKDASTPPCVRECCVLDNSTVLVTDESDNAIRLFDAQHIQYLSKFEVESEPWGITKLEGNKVAVSVPSKKEILILKFQNQKLTKESTIKTTSECWALTKYRNNGRTVLAAFSRTTQRLYCITVGTNATKEVDIKILRRVSLSHINSITADGDAGRLYLSCSKENQIFACDFEGKIIWQISHSVHTPMGLCLGLNGELNVCSYGTHEIVRFNSSGDIIDVYVHREDLNGPVAIAYMKDNGQFVVCDHGPRNSQIKLFCLQGK